MLAIPFTDLVGTENVREIKYVEILTPPPLIFFLSAQWRQAMTLRLSVSERKAL